MGDGNDRIEPGPQRNAWCSPALRPPPICLSAHEKTRSYRRVIAGFGYNA